MEKENTQTDYNDDVIDVHLASFDYTFGPYFVLVSCEGKSKIVSADDNFFAPADLVRAYRELFPEGWYAEDQEGEVEKRVAKFKEWLIETGCEPADLEEE